MPFDPTLTCFSNFSNFVDPLFLIISSFEGDGNSWENYDNYNPFELKKSTGLGIRIFMPMFGLLGLDFAYGYDSSNNSIEKSGWQTHFIIGQQF